MTDFDVIALAPLILFALWSIVIVVCLGVARAGVMAREKRSVTTFKPYGDSEQLDAISRAHMNVAENLPVFAVVYLGALWTNAGAPSLAIAWVVLGARVVQSLVHVASRSEAAVRVRALMQLIQMACFIWLGVSALRAAFAPA